MTNRIYKKESEGKSVVHIIGRLDSTKILEEFLSEFYKERRYQKSSTSLENSLIIDLTETELITEDCLKVLNRYNSKYPIEFKCHSLYVDLQLKEYGLIKDNVSN